MKIKQISIENFMSIKKTSFNFDNRGLVLITGDNQDAFDSNGAGKSTAFSEAPCWALYGQTIRGYKADKVVNKNTKKNTVVSLQIEDDNGDLYEVVRARKHSTLKNHVYLYKNGENITGKSDTDTNNMIIDLLQMDFSTFTNSIMFGQGASKMFANSTDTEQKQILERMLQIDIFKACQEEAKNMVLNLEEKIRRIESDKESIESRLRVHKTNLQELQEKETQAIKSAQEKIDQYMKDIEENQSEIESAKGEIEDLESDIEVIQKAIKKNQKTLESYKEQEEAYNTLVSDKSALLRDFKKLEKKVLKTKSELDDLRSGKSVPEVCDMCGQDLPLEDTTHMQNHLTDNIKNYTEEIKEIKDEIAELDPLIEKLEKHLKSKDRYEKDRIKYAETVAEYKGDLKLANSKIQSLEKENRNLNKLIKEQKEAQEVQYTDLIEKEIENIRVAEADIETRSNNIIRMSEELEKYSFWHTAYGNQGIKSILLDSVTPFLNRRANYYLSALSDSTMEVEFNTQTTLSSGEKRDKFSVEVRNENGEDGYKGSSNGEKRRIDVAVNMALQDLVMSRSNKKIDLIVYDEVFEGLDQIGCEAVIQLLNEKAKQCGTVMVITHSESLKQLFSNTLTVKKINGNTVIVDELSI
ncbi:recombination nuclease [Bacillus phage CampHawk]|uniref:Recombination nuclease n=1 Tax=Bacillus phage CampHawk TaxID=1406783 RepID=U5PSV3_9CAUD|nr:exonuclease [Bacillus phage CampHawk]AGY46995.1 recombination nuclease [Bacillus phage CampHawk]